MNTNQNMAKIAINKSLLKEYEDNDHRIVYLNDGDEFQIQLYNPSSLEIAAGIWLNNEKLSNLLIIRPGERIWLDRYLDKTKKFRFTTYEVEDNIETEKAIEHNGEIKIEFYNKSVIDYTYYKFPEYDHYLVHHDSNQYSNKLYPSNIIYTTNTSNTFNTSNYDLLNLTCCADTNTTSIETGRISEGSYSSQKLQKVNSDFNTYPFKTEYIKIYPISRKPYTANDLEKIYCTECGRKLKTKYKFCPFCGTKIES